jgi:malonyl-CoA O-methyltransferase
MNSAINSSATVFPQDSASVIPLRHIARSFGRAATTYDAHAELQREVADALLAPLTQVAAPAAVLDLGCGTGYCSAALRARYPTTQLYALDLALPMLQASAQRKIPGVQLVCGDAARLPFTAESIDLVFSSLTIQWCADMPGLFHELFRAVRTGGKVLLSTFGPATLAEVRAAWSVADHSVHVNGFQPLVALVAAARTAGFACTARSEAHTRHYPSLRAVAAELKGIGAHNMNSGQRRGLTPRSAFTRAEQAFAGARQAQGIPVSWEILYLNLDKP